MQARILMSASLFIAEVSQRGLSATKRAPRSLAGDVVARAAIRRFCGREAALGRDIGGRPVAHWADGCDDGTPAVSISYAGSHVCVAVADRGSVGIDIEPSRSIDERVARRVMSPSDLARFDRLAPQNREAAATRYWTCLEALLKARGMGLSQMLTRTRVLGFDSGGECEGLSFEVRAGDTGHICAFAAECVDDVGACLEDVTTLDNLDVAGSLNGRTL
jgi:phosphopantetheinyl transferase